ncbi:hypothetical protein [Agreia sp. COWG]|uniref:hypothetical protein n=1 Tax=Agreia sp. COWG TaxID=2773266 RepID=UPI0019282CD5|nr:hypothetical protein [Agreia sp. COWG]CAD5990660.1 conserved exported protein of unknown function [Agreia sp. COWG]
MLKAKSVAKVAITAGLAFGLIAAGASTAQAEPNPAGFRTYAAVGSDTIQDLYNAFGNGYGTNAAVAGTIASYDAFGTSTTIKTSATGPSYTRPAGSGDGRKALSAAYDSANHVWKTVTLSEADVKIARSSGKPSAANTVTATSTDNKLTSIPLARDAVGVATKGIASSVTNLSTEQLTAIYGGGASGTASATGNYRQSATRFSVGDVVRTTSNTSADPVIVTGVTANGAAVSASVQLNPKLPQDSSGTRSFFLGAVGASAQATWVDSGSNTFQENNATVLSTTGDVIPFSAAQYISQKNGVVADSGVSTINLPSINGAKAANLTPAGVASAGALYGDLTVPATGPFNREVYSVVPTALLASDASLNTLVTTTLPRAAAPIQAFGFQVLQYNNAGVAGTTGYIYSKFEH